mgnify:CR=1 FL=1
MSFIRIMYNNSLMINNNNNQKFTIQINHKIIIKESIQITNNINSNMFNNNLSQKNLNLNMK